MLKVADHPLNTVKSQVMFYPYGPQILTIVLKLAYALPQHVRGSRGYRTPVRSAPRYTLAIFHNTRRCTHTRPELRGVGTNSFSQKEHKKAFRAYRICWCCTKNTNVSGCSNEFSQGEHWNWFNRIAFVPTYGDIINPSIYLA